MRAKLFIKLIFLFGVTYGLTSCLEGDPSNTPPLEGSGILEMTFNPNGGNTVNSGLRYFGSQALTYPADHTADTAVFAVSIQGVAEFGKDLNVSLVTPESALDDYYYSDSIAYEMMPSNLYEFIGGTSATIKQGEDFVEFKVRFFPNKIDPTKNYMLPVTVTNDANLPMSSNYGFVYFHVIGNPIAGSYNWDFERRNNQAGTGAPAGGSFTGEDIVFAPVTPTSIKVPTGYYVQPNYLVSFKNSGGVLSNFKAEIAPDEIDAAFTANGITVVTPPTVTIDKTDPAHPKYTIKYVVFNGSAYRNCIDMYTKK